MNCRSGFASMVEITTRTDFLEHESGRAKFFAQGPATRHPRSAYLTGGFDSALRKQVKRLPRVAVNFPPYGRSAQTKSVSCAEFSSALQNAIGSDKPLMRLAPSCGAGCRCCQTLIFRALEAGGFWRPSLRNQLRLPINPNRCPATTRGVAFWRTGHVIH